MLLGYWAIMHFITRKSLFAFHLLLNTKHFLIRWPTWMLTAFSQLCVTLQPGANVYLTLVTPEELRLLGNLAVRLGFRAVCSLKSCAARRLATRWGVAICIRLINTVVRSRWSLVTHGLFLGTRLVIIKATLRVALIVTRVIHPPGTVIFATTSVAFTFLDDIDAGTLGRAGISVGLSITSAHGVVFH